MQPLRRQPVVFRMPACGVGVFESLHDRDFQSKPMRHRFWKLLLTLRGAGRFETAGSSSRFEEGDLVVVPIGQQHRLVDDPQRPLSLLAVCLDRNVLKGRTTGALPGAGVGVMRVDPLLERSVAALIRRMMYEQSAELAGSELMRVGLAKQLLALLSRRAQDGAKRGQTAGQRAVRLYVQQLSRTFFEPVDLDAAARRTGLSRRRFTQLFRQITGQSHGTYLRKLRIEHARLLLSRGRRTVTMVAFECGFADLSSFYRAFAREEGRSPGTFRDAGE
ncbi:MAG: AraC family transcriptional regulator [Phycisphaeraceae bacterium]|nr:AraC family transcriptional regulator [Phycisphaeraceae bacterium]